MPELSVAQIAAWSNRSLKQIYRYAHAGKLGDLITSKDGVILLEQGAVERHFKRPFDPNIPIPINSRPRGRPPKSNDTGVLSNFILSARFGAEGRDPEWLTHLAKLDIYIDPPPFSKVLAPNLALNSFTRQQLEHFVAAALCLRDRQWKSWAEHPFRDPYGPAPFHLSDIEPQFIASNNGATSDPDKRRLIK